MLVLTITLAVALVVALVLLVRARRRRDRWMREAVTRSDRIAFLERMADKNEAPLRARIKALTASRDRALLDLGGAIIARDEALAYATALDGALDVSMRVIGVASDRLVDAMAGVSS